ncbi:avidin/streptavidin family protein [Bradyrhizobium sp. USDA 4518]
MTSMCLCFALITVTPAKAQPIWTWTNQYGSTLSANSYDQNTGAISGAYTNNASNSCDEGVPQAVTGWLAQTNQGAAISFTVNFSSDAVRRPFGRGSSIARQASRPFGCSHSQSRLYGTASAPAPTPSHSRVKTKQNCFPMLAPPPRVAQARCSQIRRRARTDIKLE